MGDASRTPPGRRRQGRQGAATTDAQRRALAKANARPDRPARSDSRLLIAHINGGSRIRNARLLAIAAEITDQQMRIGSVVFQWIPAAANQDAHRLVAGILELHTG